MHNALTNGGFDVVSICECVMFQIKKNYSLGYSSFHWTYEWQKIGLSGTTISAFSIVVHLGVETQLQIQKLQVSGPCAEHFSSCVTSRWNIWEWANFCEEILIMSSITEEHIKLIVQGNN